MQLAFQSAIRFDLPLKPDFISLAGDASPASFRPPALPDDVDASRHGLWQFLRNASVLSTAMIAQGLMDLASPATVAGTLDEEDAECTPEEIRQNALEWFTNPESGQFSLRFCCSIINLFLARRGFAGGLESDSGVADLLQPEAILATIQRADPAFLLSLARTLLSGLRPDTHMDHSMVDFRLTEAAHPLERHLSFWPSAQEMDLDDSAVVSLT